MRKSSLEAYHERRTAHCRGRAMERYGLALSVAQVRDLEARIGVGDGLLLKRDADETLAVQIDGAVVKLVFNRATGHIKTFLPRDHKLAPAPGPKAYRREQRARPQAKPDFDMEAM